MLGLLSPNSLALKLGRTKSLMLGLLSPNSLSSAWLCVLPCWGRVCCLARLARKMAARAPSPQAVVSAPAAVAVGYRSWLVPMQNGFVRFMYTDGHGDLTLARTCRSAL